MKNIYGLSISDLEEYFLNIGEKKFKAIQVFEWLYQKRVTSFDEMTNIKKDVLDTLDNCTILTNKNVKVGFFKGIWQSILRLFAPLF